MKTQLMTLIAGTNRGAIASRDRRHAIHAAIGNLEANNPYPQVSKHLDLLAGDWELAYTNSFDVLGLDLLPLARLGEVYQCVRADAIYNIAILLGLGNIESVLTVAATLQVTGERRFDVSFRRAIFGLKAAIDYRDPSQWIDKVATGYPPFSIDVPLPQRQPAWLDVTYLDEDLRVSRGDRGSTFVLTRQGIIYQ
jgi:hypothetical protein